MDQVLFDQMETTRTRHIGFIAEGTRFDYSLTFSQHFFGKTLVTCLQSGNTGLLDWDDANIVEHLSKIFDLNSEDAVILSNFLKESLGDQMLRTQY